MRKKPAEAPATSAGPSPGLRQYLYFTAGVTGMVIMIVEILGAKMLAPYVGMSHFVWTAQIAVTLVALATGYYGGGWLVDHTPRLGRLYAAILLAAVYLCLTVIIVKPVAFWCLDFTPKLAVGSLMASTILFFIPLALLAMTGPFFVRVLTSAVNNVGGNVGRLTATGTFGSFIGTVLIGYVLIPFLPNSMTMFLSAALLLCVGAGYYIGWGRKAAPLIATALTVAAGVALGCGGVVLDRRPPVAKADLLFRGNSNFGQLLVIDTEEPQGLRRYYLNDLLAQDIYDASAKQSTAMFTYMLHDLAVAYTPQIQDVLCIGMGVGIVPGKFARDGVNVDVVEINPAVVPVARQFFDCPVEQLHITIGDGRQFLNRCARRYDAVVLDAFLGDSSPSHLMTKEAFAAMRGVLKPDGVLVINTFGELMEGHDFLGTSMYRTLQSVFKSVRIHHVYPHNMLFVASDQAELKILHPPDFTGVHSDCRESAKSTFGETPDPDPHRGILLTDDYNPVEFYDAANREQTRKYLVARWRR